MGRRTTTNRLLVSLLQKTVPELVHDLGGDDVTGILRNEVHDEDTIDSKVLL